MYVNAETGEVLDFIDALLCFAEGGSIDWYIDGEKCGSWNPKNRAGARELFERFSEIP